MQYRSLSTAGPRHGPLRAGCATVLTQKKAVGSRIPGIEHIRTGKTIDPAKTYIAAGWGSVADQVEGPPVWEVIESYLWSSSRPCALSRKPACGW